MLVYDRPNMLMMVMQKLYPTLFFTDLGPCHPGFLFLYFFTSVAICSKRETFSMGIAADAWDSAQSTLQGLLTEFAPATSMPRQMQTCTPSLQIRVL